MDCDHDKCYSPNFLTSWPPKRDWICRKCKATGRDTSAPAWEFFDEYARLLKEKQDGPATLP